MVDIEQQVRNILITKFNLSERTLSQSKNMIEESLLSSIEFVQLTTAVENIFDIEFENDDFSAMNFKNAASIADLVCRKRRNKAQ